MSPILAFAATLLALIFSAPVLYASAARTPAVIDAAAAVPGGRQVDDSVDGSPELLPGDEDGGQFK
ncbi:hypothetical protein ACFFTM_01550 [Pseudoduganella plicata]|uniref:Secreted protein n=1 Tax=Pseudoduganella plicata TaxID=321984 RepID=A0ABX5SAU3_9BURK|nr:hypothetical protein [Pseudoduganella plicata]QBQ36702.1 hypothetical protein E1742_11400 [Pseudoduganella plicata]